MGMGRRKAVGGQENKTDSLNFLTYILIGVVLLVIVGSMSYIYYSGNRMTAVHGPLATATLEIRLESATAHLWFEELVGGDKSRSISDVYEHLDQAQWYSQAMLEGGETKDGRIYRLSDEKLRGEVEDIQGDIHQLRAIMEKRYANLAQSGPGSEIDQEYDRKYLRVAQAIDEIETQLRGLIRGDLGNFRLLQGGLILFSLVVTISAGIVIIRLQRRQVLDAVKLRAANQQLDAGNQQLKAGNQQLRAGNQQLRATEQQLRAANQQLGAHEMQLVSNNQQLLAGEQELRAVNQQLMASEKELVDLAKFPGENPNPVLRVAKDGTILYANDACLPLLSLWQTKAGKSLPADLRETMAEVFAEKACMYIEAVCEGRIYSLMCVPVVEAGDVNLYGRDISEQKTMADELVERTHLNKILLDNMPCMAVLMRPKTREIIASNAVAIKAGAVVGRRCFETLNQREAPCPWCHAPELWESGEAQHIEYEAQGLIWDAHWVRISDDLFMHYIFDVTDRKQAEQALRQSEERFRDFFENAPIGYHIFGSDKIIIDVNNAELEMIGYTRDEIVGKKTWTELIIPEQRAQFEKHWQAIVTKGNVRELEYILVHKDGHYVDVVLNASSRFDENGNFINTRGAVLNITARKQAEQALRQSEERFRRSVLDSPFPIMIHAEDGEVLHISKVWTELTGYEHEEIPTLSAWTQRAYGEDRNIVKSRIDKIFDYDGRAEEGEYVISSKEGGTLIWDFSSAPLGTLPDGRRLVISMAMDVTARKQAEEMLKTQRYYLARAQEIGSIGTWDMDIEKNELIWTDETYRIFGIAIGTELTYESFLNCVHPDDREYVDSQFGAALKGSPYDIEHRIVVDGNVKWVREKAEIEFNEKGNGIRGTGFTQDITEHKQAQERIANLAKFPSENPNPVLRVSSDGTIIYTNAASFPVLKTWGCKVGERIPEDCCKRVDEVFRTGKICNFEFNCHNELILSMTLSPVIDGGYANIYGLDITRRKQIEQELINLNEELEQRVADRTVRLVEAHKQLLEDVEERKRLEKEIIGVSEREKRLVGQELHDSVGQQLVGAGFVAQVLSNDLLDKLPEKAIKASEMVELIKVALEQTRGIARGLHPVDLDSGNLMTALAELADDTRRLFNVSCTFKCNESIKIDDVEMAGNLYRIAQESITNAVKHGMASEINMSFVSSSNYAALIVEDNGCGISEDIDRSKGIGLRIMKYRAEMIGGRLDIRGGCENGTVVTCRFSVKRGAKVNGADHDTEKKPDQG